MTQNTLLRSRTGDHHGRVGFVELFFDLVFVFAVTQISHLLLGHPDVAHALQSAFLLVAMWVVWMWTTWATNWLDVERTPTRIMLFLAMAGGLVLAAALPHAFDERGFAFALTFVAIQVGRTIFLVTALRGGKENERRNFERMLVYLCVTGALWIAGGLAQDINTRWAFWLSALFIEMASPLWGFWTPLMGRSTPEDWRVDPEHMSERAGLFVIIALGESVILIGATFAGVDTWDAPHFGALAGAFGGAVAMWWIYFATIAEEARDAFITAENPGALARTAYTYAHIPIVAGIVLSAVGNEIVLAHPTGHTEFSTMLITVGGAGLFLAGSLWFSWLCGKPLMSHILGLGALVVCALLSGAVEPVWLNAMTTVVLFGVGAWATYGEDHPSRNMADT